MASNHLDLNMERITYEANCKILEFADRSWNTVYSAVRLQQLPFWLYFASIGYIKYGK